MKPSVVPGGRTVVWIVEWVSGTGGQTEAAEPWHGVLLGPSAVSEVGTVKEAEEELGVVVVTAEASEVAPEADAELAYIAGDIAGTVAVGVPEPRSAAELGLVVSELYCKRPSGVVAVAWDSGASFGVVFEARVGFVLEATFEAGHMKAPWENSHGVQSEELVGPIVAQLELLDMPEVEFGLVAAGMVGEWVVCAGDCLDLGVLVCQSTAGMETDPGGNPAGKAEAVLYPVDAG